MVFERREEEVIDFNTVYRVRLPAVVRCRIMLESEKMEEVSEFKYLGPVLRKHGGMEGEIRERVMKGRSVVGSLAGVMKGRNVSMDVKRDLRNSILLPTLNIWIGELDMEWGTTVEGACCRDELPERNVWSESMGWAEQ